MNEKEARIKDAEEVKEVLRAVREEVPGLLREIVDPLKELMGMTLDEETAKEKAKAIAAFYQELIKGGIDKETALRLTEEQFVNPIYILKSIMGGKVKDWKEEEH